MKQINPLLKCHTLRLLDDYIGDPSRVQQIYGRWGGRRFTKVPQNRLFNFSVNQLVSQLILLSENPVQDARLIRKLIQKIRTIDARPMPRISPLKKILTAVRRFFGNYFMNRQVLLADLEKKLPALQPEAKIPPPVLRSQPHSSPHSPLVRTPSQSIVEEARFYRNIKEVIDSPYSNPTESVQGLVKQCSEDHTVDLQNQEVLKLIEGIFSHCIVDKIVTKYSVTQTIDIYDWLSRHPTFDHRTLDAALKGLLAHLNPSFSALLNLVKFIQTLRMKKAPDSLGSALAKMVELDANANPFENLFRYLLKEKHLTQADYTVILLEFRRKQTDPSKAGCRWIILDLLQEHARQEGWE